MGSCRRRVRVGPKFDSRPKKYARVALRLSQSIKIFIRDISSLCHQPAYLKFILKKANLENGCSNIRLPSPLGIQLVRVFMYLRYFSLINIKLLFIKDVSVPNHK